MPEAGTAWLFDSPAQVRADITNHERNLEIDLGLLRRLAPVPNDYTLREVDIYFRGLLDSDKVSRFSTGLLQHYRDEVVARLLLSDACIPAASSMRVDR